MGVRQVLKKLSLLSKYSVAILQNLKNTLVNPSSSLSFRKSGLLGLLVYYMYSEIFIIFLNNNILWQRCTTKVLGLDAPLNLDLFIFIDIVFSIDSWVLLFS